MSIHFSSKSQEWETPQEVFKEWDEIYNFNLDVCATEKNKKCSNYFSIKENGLNQEWKGSCWMNPPYGREIGLWMKKAYESALGGAVVVCLVPARTDTKWWHDYAMKGKIVFLKGRLKFNNHKNSAPFPSAVVIFDKSCLHQTSICSAQAFNPKCSYP